MFGKSESDRQVKGCSLFFRMYLLYRTLCSCARFSAEAIYSGVTFGKSDKLVKSELFRPFPGGDSRKTAGNPHIQFTSIVYISFCILSIFILFRVKLLLSQKHKLAQLSFKKIELFRIDTSIFNRTSIFVFFLAMESNPDF